MQIHAKNGSDAWTLHAGCRLSSPPDGHAARARSRAGARALPARDGAPGVLRRGGEARLHVRAALHGRRDAVPGRRRGARAGAAAGRSRARDERRPRAPRAVRRRPAGPDRRGHQPRPGAGTASCPRSCRRRPRASSSHRPVGATFWSHATVQELTPESFQGTVSLHDEDGNLLLRVEGLRAKTLEDTAAADGPDAADILYRAVVGGEAPRRRPTDDAWCAPASVAASVAREADRLSGELGFAGYYRDVEPGLERIARAFFVRALGALGIGLEPGATLRTRRAARRRRRCRKPRQRQLTRSAERWRTPACSRPRATASASGARLPADDPLALVEALRAQRPGWSSVIDLLSRCGRALADVLAGRRDGSRRAVLGRRPADDGRLLSATRRRAGCSTRSPRNRWRRRSPTSRPAASCACSRSARAPAAPRATCCPRLPSGRTQFTFTDVSPLFVNLARAEFGEGAGCATRPSTSARDPARAGPRAGRRSTSSSAANVVHGTPDVGAHAGPPARACSRRAACSSCRRSRAGRAGSTWCSASPTAGGRSRIASLRPAHALLDPPSWLRALGDAGFDEAATLSEREDAVARPVGPAGARARWTPLPAPRGQSWLVLADRRGVGEVSRSACAAAAMPASSRTRRTFRATAPGAFEVPLAEPLAMRRLLGGIRRAHGRGAPLEPRHAGAGARQRRRAARRAGLGYGSMLDLLHALQRPEGAPACGGASLVTAGAQAIDEAADATAVAQAPLWGFGARACCTSTRSCARCSSTAAPRPGPRRSEALAREVTAEEREDEVALRGGRRYVRRLVRLAPRRARDLRGGAGARARPRVPRRRGRRRRARHLAAARGRAAPALDRDEIEIEVRAASLNFRDVMFAMGMLPAAAFDNMLSAGALGVDCAGVVSAVGEDVTHVRPGDEVVALSPASLASHAMTRDLVVRKPAGPVLRGGGGAAARVRHRALLAREHGAPAARRARAHPRRHRRRGAGRVAVAAARGRRDLRHRGQRGQARVPARARRRATSWTRARWTSPTRSCEITRGRGVDVVLNSLSGEAIAKGLSRAGAARALPGDRQGRHLPERRPRARALQPQPVLLRDPDRPAVRRRTATSCARRCMDMVDGIEEGALPPLPTQVFPSRSIEEGLRTLAQARHIGKVVIAMDDPEVAIRPARRRACRSSARTRRISSPAGAAASAPPSRGSWSRAARGTLALVSRGARTDEGGARGGRAPRAGRRGPAARRGREPARGRGAGPGTPRIARTRRSRASSTPRWSSTTRRCPSSTPRASRR